jgi:SAM-dependent methyltransferase
MRDAGVLAIGVDSDPEAVEICGRAGYDIRSCDIFEYLDTSGDFDGIMASHVIEHLNFTSAERLVGRCFSVLRSDGILIFVTPNPENLTAITKTFWLDPTHVRPYPLDLLVELVKSGGFEIVAAGGAEATRPQGIRAVIKRVVMGPLLRLIGLGQLRHHLYGAHDIYVVGRKP